MKTVTVREAQHNLAAILRDVERGEEIEVVRRKKPVARISPIAPSAATEEPVDWSGHRDHWKRIWGEQPPGGATAEELLDDLRGDR